MRLKNAAIVTEEYSDDYSVELAINIEKDENSGTSHGHREGGRMRKFFVGHLISSNVLKLLLLFLFVISLLLVFNVAVNVRDSADGWILDGVIASFLLFAGIYSIIVGFSADLRLTTIVTSVFLMIVNLIPNLKYSFIYGINDPLGHYGVASEIIKSTHVPQTGIYGSEYGQAPDMHIFLSTLSIVSGFDVGVSIKVFLTVFPSILPIIVFLVTRKMNFPTSLSKLAIVSTIVTSPITYIFTGTRAIYFLYAIFSCFLVLFFASRKFNRAYLMITIILGFAIVLSHETTSFYLAMFFIFALLFSRFLKNGRSYALLILLLLGVYLAHFIFASGLNLKYLLSLLSGYMPFTAKERFVTDYYSGFFKLDLLDRVKVLTVELGRDLVVGSISLLSIPVVLKLKPEKKELRRFYYLLFLFSLLPATAFLVSAGGFNIKYRFWAYLVPFTPFFVGLTLWSIAVRINFSRTGKRLLATILIFSLICISILETYPPQTLIPKVATEFGERYVKNYQTYISLSERSLISFVVKHDSKLKINATGTTLWVMYGLTEISFQSLLLESDKGTMVPSSQPILILISSADFFYPFGVESERSFVEALQTENVIYTNGEAFCFSTH